MTRIKRVVLLLLPVLFFLSGGRAWGQYYDWGQEPAGIKWQQIKTPEGKFVFPDYYRRHAVRLMHYMDTLRPYAGYGYRYGPMKMPVVMHTQNFSPNAIVMQAPNRMEFILTPPPSTFAVPWHKQLVAHEYRHAVQYNNLNKGLIGVLRVILGQQGSLVGAALFPVWLLEGDAVMAETQLTAFGRAMQPSFTIDYRAMLLEGRADGYRPDKFFSGSYVDHMPDHYHVGYQVASFAYTRYGNGIFDKLARYSARNPYMLVPFYIGVSKFYKTSDTKIFWETFDDLKRYWQSLPRVDNSSKIIGTPLTSFTTYSTPVMVNDSVTVALKKDLDRPSRIVRIDNITGREELLHRTGIINTGLVRDGDRLWWTELRQSTLWEQRLNSQLRYYDMSSGEMGTVRGKNRVLFPTAVEGGGLAWLEYDYRGFYVIKHGEWERNIPDSVSVHGLAYDDVTERFYFIGLSDEGMWIGSARQGIPGFEVVKRATYSTLSDLRAGGGRLYYGSIASGKDEAHIFDIASGKEYRATESRYGSFSPAPANSKEKIIVTTYTADGYLPATQDVDLLTMEEVPFSTLPRNTVNPERVKWDLPKIDTVRIGDTTGREIRKFNRSLNLFQFHSWAPAYFDATELLSENNFHVNLGAVALSQNLLNSAVASVGYRYTEEGSFFTGKFRYYGLPVKLQVEAEYGTMDQLVYKPAYLNINRDLGLKNYFRANIYASLPLLLSAEYHIRSLTPSLEFEHENSKLYYPSNEHPAKFRNGMQRFRFAVQYTDNVRMAHRDILPHWGYALRFTNTINPFNNYMGGIISGFGRVYLPGIGAHHSLMVRGAVQRQGISLYNFRQKELYPRGADYGFIPERYFSFAVDYQLPLCYPENGIPGYLYFRRVRANLCYDYARYKTSRGDWGDVYSYGVDITFDISPLRLPASTSTALTITIHKPSDRSGVVVGVGFSLPI